MTAPSPESAGTPPPVRRLWRCRRHPERPAAARCPECGEPHCRECVVEHEGRILCAACLARLTAGDLQPAISAGHFRSFLRAFAGVLALIATLWLGLVLVREFLEPAKVSTVTQFAP